MSMQMKRLFVLFYLYEFSKFFVDHHGLLYNNVGGGDAHLFVGATSSGGGGMCGHSDYVPPRPPTAFHILDDNNDGGVGNNFSVEQQHNDDLGGRYEIVDGHEVPSPTSLPWLAALLFNSTYLPFVNHTFWCTASIVSRRYILTAGHCVWLAYQQAGFNDTGPYPSIEFTNFAVHIGSTDWSNPNVTAVRSRRIIPHPNFVLAPVYIMTIIYNDIALIELETPLNWTEEIQPICLANEEIGTQPIGTELVIAGWGKIKPEIESNGSRWKKHGHRYQDDDPKSDWPVKKLRDGWSTVMNTSGCKEVLLPGTWDQAICVNSSHAHVYDGDSGGPLMYRSVVDGAGTQSRWWQVGTTSAGSAHGNPPDTFMKVSAFCSWFELVTANGEDDESQVRCAKSQKIGNIPKSSIKDNHQQSAAATPGLVEKIHRVLKSMYSELTVWTRLNMQQMYIEE